MAKQLKTEANMQAKALPRIPPEAPRPWADGPGRRWRTRSLIAHHLHGVDEVEQNKDQDELGLRPEQGRRRSRGQGTGMSNHLAEAMLLKST